MKIVVTGAGGFIGGHLCAALAAAGYEVRTPVALQGADAVVHLANIAHRRASEDELNRVNVEGTARLAQDAAAAGVRRFVYLSSAKVHGERTAGVAFSEGSPLAPADTYARSKCDAERALAETRGIETVVLRPPLVYGPRVKANFLALLRAVARGWPLPLASIENRRSLIYVGNLVDAMLRCLEAPAAAGRSYLVCDGAPLSTPALCRAIGDALGRPTRLFRCPPMLLELIPPLRRLTQSMEIDGSMLGRELGWTPPYTLGDGLKETARWYREAFATGG